MLIQTFPETATPAGLRGQVLALQQQVWPGGSGLPAVRPTHDPALRPVSMILTDDGIVVAALDILTKDITHAGEHYVASGLSTVVTSRVERRKGFGRRLVAAARSAVQASGADLGIFTCDRLLQTFYESTGWRVLDGSVLVGGTSGSPFPSDQFDKIVMASFFSARARRNESAFTHSRIKLYPGTIDKLW
jgi:GNAT superfamily N-acetyltransferase